MSGNYRDTLMENRGKILVVDDDDLVRHSLRAMFIYTGYDVDVAGSSEEALQFASNHSFDVLVTDYRMDGMDGLNLCRELKKRGSTFAAVMISGFGDDELVEEARREGVMNLFLKPLNFNLLEESIAAAIRRSKEAPAQ